MPFNFIRLTKFLLMALVAGQTLHLSLSKAAPTPGVTSDTSVVAQDPVIIDSEWTHFSSFDSLSIHGGVACSQCELDSISERGNPVLNRRKEPMTPEDIQLAYFTFERLKNKPDDDEKLINTLLINLSELELLTQSSSLPDEQLKYVANQYRWAYYGYLKRRLERNNPISLTPALELVIMFSKGIQNLGPMDTGKDEVEEAYRSAYLNLLNLLRIKPGDEADHPPSQTESYVEHVVERFIAISNIGIVPVSSRKRRNKEVKEEIVLLTRAKSDARRTPDERAVANAYLSLYHIAT
ncbi:hypothetical protein H0H93_005113 [Arthromyces matolae]|nr:hypothetical protein H0H93_005113 [Arthromyces matolae]